MSCATSCLKCLIILCNFLIATIGLVILAGGIFLMTGSQEYINKYTTKFTISAEVGNWTDSKNSSSIDGGGGGGDPSPDFSAFITPFGIVLVVIGTLFTVIGLVGICGVCCSSRILLVIYAAVTILLILAEIVITLLFFLHAFDDRIRNRAQFMLTEHYAGLHDLGQDSLTWNYIMIKFQCCGINDYKDFEDAKKWPPAAAVAESDHPHPQLLLNATQVTPLACCKMAPRFHLESDFACSTNPRNETSNWQTGCWDKVAAVLLPYRTVTIGIISAILVAQALLALIAILVAWRLPKNWKNL